MTGITAAVPYAFSALAQLVWRLRDGHVPPAPHSWSGTPRPPIVALALSVAFIYYSRNTADDWYVVWGPVPDDRRSVRARCARLPVPAQAHDRAGRRAVVQVTGRAGVQRQLRGRSAARGDPCTDRAASSRRLTPTNVESLLFDDVMWADRAREEHDLFAKQLVDHGVTVHHFADLLAEALDSDDAREFVAARAA